MSLLGGVRVLDLTRAWAGPLAGRMLADLGAEVIHIEYAAARGAGVVGTAGFNMTASSDWEWGEMPEPSIRAGLFPDANPGPDPWNRQASFNKLNRSKQSLCVDLHEPEGQKIFRGLVAVSDVVLENYSPRGARSLGVEFETLRDVNPRIVVVSISGYGHSGPNHDRVALGPIIEAESGLAGLTGYRKGGPNKLGAAMPDAITGLNGAAATIAALACRDATGAGLHADVSMLESFAAIGGEAFLAASDSGVAPDRRGNRSLRWAPQGAYRCAGNDEWIAITVRSTAEWRRLVEVLDAPPLRDPRFADPAVRSREQPYIDRIIESWTAGQSKWGAWRQLRDRDLVAFPVMTNSDLVHDEQLNARGFMVEWDQPGIGPRLYPGIPIRFDPPLEYEIRPAALLGQHNRTILRDLLGYDDATIDKLESTGVIATEPPPSRPAP
jgi:crotonobetainyl-CoA:carnitine CoA-transferase CaiB-like acyl-CoA transferase